jgi:hypothetical protein
MTRKETERLEKATTGRRKKKMNEEVRLVTERGFSVAKTDVTIKRLKKNAVPRMTLHDRINTNKPVVQPKAGRLQELSPIMEQAIIKCLIMWSEFQYLMRKRDVQLLIQS